MKPQLHCPVLSVFATKYALTDKHVQRLVSFLNSRKISNMIPELVRRMGAPIVRTPYVRILEVIHVRDNSKTVISLLVVDGG